MKHILCSILLGLLPAAATAGDWLIDPTPYRAAVATNANELVLENGLARRVIRLSPNAATMDLQNLTTGEHVLRAIAPEARVTIDGVEYEVGGLKGQPVANYIKAQWLEKLTASSLAYRYAGCTVGETQARFPWLKRREWMSRDLPWPPPGKHVVLRFVPPGGAPQKSAPQVILNEDFSGQNVAEAGMESENGERL